MNGGHPWRALSVTPTLQVADMDEAVAYYEKLGFSELWRYPGVGANGGDTGEPTHVGLEFAGVQLMLARADESTDRIERQNIYINMKGVRQYHDALSRRLDEPVPDLTESDYGMLDFALRDPWGHLLTFGEEC